MDLRFIVITSNFIRKSAITQAYPASIFETYPYFTEKKIEIK